MAPGSRNIVVFPIEIQRLEDTEDDIIPTLVRRVMVIDGLSSGLPFANGDLNFILDYRPIDGQCLLCAGKDPYMFHLQAFISRSIINDIKRCIHPAILDFEPSNNITSTGVWIDVMRRVGPTRRLYLVHSTEIMSCSTIEHPFQYSSWPSIHNLILEGVYNEMNPVDTRNGEHPSMYTLRLLRVD